MNGEWKEKGKGRFTIEAVCAPLDENTAEVTLSLEATWNAPAIEKMDVILITLRHALGLPGPDVDVEKVEMDALHTFSVNESRGFKHSKKWRAMLTENSAVFFDPETERTLTVPRDAAWTKIVFIKNAGLMGSQEGTIATVSGVNLDMGEHKNLLLSWFPPQKKSDMKKELRNWGIGLIAVGVISIFLSAYLDPIWGIMLIVIGIINLFAVHRVMFVINGIVIAAAGALNIISALPSGTTAFCVFGIFQIVWGIDEIRKFGKYRSID